MNCRICLQDLRQCFHLGKFCNLIVFNWACFFIRSQEVTFWLVQLKLVPNSIDLLPYVLKYVAKVTNYDITWHHQVCVTTLKHICATVSNHSFEAFLHSKHYCQYKLLKFIVVFEEGAVDILTPFCLVD